MNVTAPLDALVCGYTSANRRRKALMMLQGFADESESDIVSMTGCILPYPDWTAFIEQWNDILLEAPAISYFHMREARALQGPFSGWTELQRDLKIIRLVEVISNHRPHTITVWVRKEEFEKILKPNTTYESKFCYFHCFFALMFYAAGYNKRRGVHLPTDFVFDEKGSVGIEAVNWYEWVVKGADDDLKPYFGATPIFRDDVNILPLQAADLVGWHIHRKLENPGIDPERAATDRVDQLPMGSIELKRDFLEQISTQFAEVLASYQPLSELMRIKPSRRRKLLKKLKTRVHKIVNDTTTSEYEKFDRTMRQLVKVSHTKR